MITLDVLALPDDCLWQGEFDALPVAATTARTVSGRLVVVETGLSYGRPVDLGGEDAWISRDTLEILHGFAGTPGWSGRLTLHDGRSFLVRFRTQVEKPVEVAPVLSMADPGGADRYQLVALRLETVA